MTVYGRVCISLVSRAAPPPSSLEGPAREPSRLWVIAPYGLVTLTRLCDNVKSPLSCCLMIAHGLASSRTDVGGSRYV